MESKAKILLVDDDVDWVEAMKIILEGKSYEVVVAYEGEAGIRKAREENPDLILLDIIMPLKDGFTTAEQLKKDPELNKIPIIMLTCFADKRGETTLSVSRGYDLETEDYLDKSISPEELIASIERYVKK